MFTGITRDEQNEPTASFIRDMKFEKKRKGAYMNVNVNAHISSSPVRAACSMRFKYHTHTILMNTHIEVLSATENNVTLVLRFEESHCRAGRVLIPAIHRIKGALYNRQEGAWQTLQTIYS